MSQLGMLRDSLATVIVRYHDSLAAPLVNASNKTEMHLKSRQLAADIINDSSQDFKAKLNEIIQSCTKGYPGRRPFLNFILNEIELLHSFLNKKNSFSPEEFIEYKEQVLRLLLDFKGLLETPKSKTYAVTQHQTTTGAEGVIALSGCKNDGYTGNEFCNSGIFLKEEVLATLNIKISFTEDKYREFVERICIEHQNALLVPELLAKLQENELARSADQQTIKELTVQKAQETKPEPVEDNSKLIEIIQQQKLELEKQRESIGDLKKQVQAKAEGAVRKPFGGFGFYTPGLALGLARFPNQRMNEIIAQTQEQLGVDPSDFDDLPDFKQLDSRQ